MSTVVQLRPRATARRTAALRSRLLDRRRTVGPYRHRLLEITGDVLGRVGQVGTNDLDAWERLLQFLEEHEDNTFASPADAATANLVALALFGEAGDHAALADLAGQLGHERLARLQHRHGSPLESHPGLPLTSEAVRRLVASDLRERLAADPRTAARVEAVDDTCLRAAHALLNQGTDRTWTVPVLDSVEELLDIAERGTIVEWRHHMAMVTAQPWSPYTGRIVALAQEAGKSHTASVIAAFVDLCRERTIAAGRPTFEREVDSLVALGDTRRGSGP
ncbi:MULTISPECIES: hypothetical protein [unclassified Nocardioides]|uniref:hypothetical protein n=1 Tax=unclassified Nocardioides TaxID=2615069 RepID=UPI0006FDF1C0|nr:MULTISPECIES: hypothetical protein [unclassified Nocardioides]KRA31194.1 hypothetical protein ASD81_17140 [Nocardioides sp. Root614]KRA87814.1 hypothetical protein ASD84_17410 [Nocardioides sp. Root682]